MYQTNNPKGEPKAISRNKAKIRIMDNHESELETVARTRARTRYEPQSARRSEAILTPLCRQRMKAMA